MNRSEAFSDGVFAIIVTLLGLELKVLVVSLFGVVMAFNTLFFIVPPQSSQTKKPF